VSYLDNQDEIVALVETIPNVDVYRGQMSDEAFAALLTDSNQIKPFITISFGGLLDPRRRINGIVGAKANSQDTTFVVRTVGSTDRTAQKAMQLVLDKLIGFVPTDCGEIDTALFGSTGQVSSLGNPTRFASVQAFRFLVNSPYTSVTG
jgi:hypothetical protein